MDIEHEPRRDGLRTSVVLPVFNGERTISGALESIANQTRKVDEVIVVNDGSIDNTACIVETWRSTLPVKVIDNGRNLGLITSLRRAVDLSTGELIFRLDADDEWLPYHVERLSSLARHYPNADLFCGRTRSYLPNGNPLSVCSKKTEKSIRKQLMWDNPIVHSAVAFRKKAYDKAGGYLGPKYAEDYDLWIRMLALGGFIACHDVSVKYLVSDTSFSRVRRSLAISTRLSLQKKALFEFGWRHPLSFIAILPIVLARGILNRTGIRA